MDALNKIVFLILGLVAVIILFAVVSGKIDLKNKFPKFSDTQKKITPTIVKEQNVLNNVKKSAVVKSTANASQTKSIPATGVETAFIPLSFVLMAAGFYLKRKS